MSDMQSLRSRVNRLSDQIQNTEMQLKKKFIGFFEVYDHKD